MLVVPNKRAARAWPSREVLAVLEGEPLHAWIGSAQEVRLVALAPGQAPEGTVAAHVLDAVGLSKGRVLACVARAGDPRVRLVVVGGAALDLAGARELALPKATRVEWPGGIWAKDAVPWPEDDLDEDDEPPAVNALAKGHALPDGTFAFDDVVFSANDLGVVVTGAYAGVIAALPPDASRVDFSVRLPTQGEETEIFAARTRAGVVAVVCVEGRHAAILHIAPDGRVLASRHKIGRDLAWGMGPPVVQGERVIVFEVGEKGGDRLHTLELADLSVVKSTPLGERPGGSLSVCCAGDTFLLGTGARACLVKRGARGVLALTLLEHPVVRRAITPPAAAPLAAGPPSLSLTRAVERPAPWETSVGQQVAIDITFTNQGGASRGVAVEIGGPAITQGLVRAERVRIGDLVAPLAAKGSTAVGELPAVALPAGLSPDLYGGKKALPLPAAAVLLTHIDLVGVKAGSAVLTVRITPLGAAPTRGSVLQGKSLTVHGGNEG